MSELALIKEKTLSDIGDAIREKTATTEKLKPKEMPAKIKSIQTGVSIDDLLDKGYNLTIDKDSFTNQYPVYNIYVASGTNGEVSGVDIPNKYLGNGFFSIDVKLKPKEGYNIGTMKIESSEPDENATEYHEYVLSDIKITQTSAATLATEIDFSSYMNTWYHDSYKTMTELTADTKAIMQNTSIKAKAPEMHHTFADCQELKVVPKIQVQTSDINSMDSFALHCRNLEKVDLSGMNLSKVNTLFHAFEGSEKLKQLILSESSFKRTVDNINIASLCENCFNLEVLDLRGIKLSNTTKFISFVLGCSKLKYILIKEEDTSIFVNSNFVAELGKAGITTSCTLLIDNISNLDLKQLKDDIETAGLTGQYNSYNINLASSNKYTITDNGDGTLTIAKKLKYKLLNLNDTIRYEEIPSDYEDRLIRLRVKGTSAFKVDSYSFENLELPIVFKSEDDVQIFKISPGEMSILKAGMSIPPFNTAFPNLLTLLNSGKYDNNCLFMILDSRNYYICLPTGAGINVIEFGKCSNGIEYVLQSFNQAMFATQLEIVKLEYVEISEEDIKLTDYKLNFD